MKLKNQLKTYAMIIFTATMLYGGVAVINTSQANNGMPSRILSGEVGERINLFYCLLADLGNPNFECNDIYVSASDTNYIMHGWGSAVGEDMGDGQPFTFQAVLNGEELTMRRFATGGGNSGGVSFLFYVIFEPGDLPVGAHSIEGIWTSKEPNFAYFSTETTLIVSA